MSVSNIFEQGNVVSILYPSDLQTAVTDDWICMKGYHAADIIFFKGAGTATQDPDIHILQATNSAGASAKGVNVTQYYKKQGTLLSTTNVGGTFTKTTMTASYIISFDATSAEEQGLYGIHIEADMLDAANGFDWISTNIPDVGANAQLGCVLAVLYPGRYKDDSGGVNPLV